MGAALTRLRGLAAVLRTRSFDTSTEEGREHERHRRVALTILTSAIAKGATLLANVVSLPLTLHYLGPERFGIWTTISSLSIVMAFGDLGMGNGLLNAVASAHGRNDRLAIKEYVSSACVVLSMAGAVFFTIFWAISWQLSWAHLLNVRGPDASDAAAGVLAFAACFALRIPVDIAQRVQVALQMGFVANLWQVVSAISGLIGIVIAIAFRGGIAALVMGSLALPLLVSCANALWFFGSRAKDLRPAWSCVSYPRARQVIATGSLFFVLQCAASLGFAIDPIIVARTMGHTAVAEFSVVSRLFEFLILFVAMFVTPLWPAYAEAVSRGDARWVHNTLRRSMKWTLVLLAVGAAALFIFGRPILTAWLGNADAYSRSLFAWFAVWTVLRGLGVTFAMFLNGAGIVRAQMISATIFGVCAVAAKTFATARFGVDGIVWATFATYAVTTALPYVVLAPTFLDIRGRNLSRSRSDTGPP